MLNALCSGSALIDRRADACDTQAGECVIAQAGNITDSSLGQRTSPFVRNAWYVAARSEDLAKDMLGLVLLDLPVVLFRTGAGKAAALIDACSHRKFPLSKSCLAEDRIRCGYHGFEFDTTGRCIGIPASDTIPKEADIRSFPIAEIYGFVWIWMGVADHADPSLIPDCSHLAIGIQAQRSDQIACHYQALIENLLDFSHLPFVHASNQGHAGNAMVPPRVRIMEYGLRAERRIENSPAPPVFSQALGVQAGELIHHTQNFEFHAPCVVIIHQSIVLAEHPEQGPLHFSSNHFITPSTAWSTLYFSTLVQKNDAMDDDILAGMSHAAAVATAQDKEVLELQDLSYRRLAGNLWDAQTVASRFDRAPLLSRSILKRLSAA